MAKSTAKKKKKKKAKSKRARFVPRARSVADVFEDVQYGFLRAAKRFEDPWDDQRRAHAQAELAVIGRKAKRGRVKGHKHSVKTKRKKSREELTTIDKRTAENPKLSDARAAALILAEQDLAGWKKLSRAVKTRRVGNMIRRISRARNS